MEKVMVMVPTSGNIFPDTAKCIWDLGTQQANHENYYIDFDFVCCHTVDRSRNLCVRKAIEARTDRILFVDSDMTFDPDFLDKLMEHDLDVVMGYYDHRPGGTGQEAPDATNLCKLGQFSYLEQVTVSEIDEAREEGYDLIEVKGGGLGFCLVKAEVFSLFPYPWFDFVEYPDGQCLSEDLFFSEMCARNGIRIYADTRCYCGHIFRQRHGGHETVHQD